MQDFEPYKDVLRRMSEARRIARDHAPRGSNDELEAGMLLAMILAYSDWVQAAPQAEAAAAGESAHVTAADVPEAAPAGEVQKAEPAAAEAAEAEDEEPPPTTPRRRR